MTKAKIIKLGKVTGGRRDRVLAIIKAAKEEVRRELRELRARDEASRKSTRT